jgi:hypothetical protein
MFADIVAAIAIMPAKLTRGGSDRERAISATSNVS